MSAVYIEREGRQFGFEARVRVVAPRNPGPDHVLHEIDGSVFTWPVLRARLWALSHGYGWPRT